MCLEFCWATGEACPMVGPTVCRHGSSHISSAHFVRPCQGGGSVRGVCQRMLMAGCASRLGSPGVPREAAGGMSAERPAPAGVRTGSASGCCWRGVPAASAVAACLGRLWAASVGCAASAAGTDRKVQKRFRQFALTCWSLEVASHLSCSESSRLSLGTLRYNIAAARGGGSGV